MSDLLLVGILTKRQAILVPSSCYLSVRRKILDLLSDCCVETYIHQDSKGGSEHRRTVTSQRWLWAVIVGFVTGFCFFGSAAESQDFHTQTQNGQKIIITKSEQILVLTDRGGKIKKIRVCLGLNPIGAKRITGDQKTPEGDYFICSKSTASSFYRFLGISYPGPADAQNAFERGLISLDDRDSILESARNWKAPPWNTKLGGWVGIHGYPTDWYKRLWVILYFPKPHNWTDGCIAMWNFEMEELFNRVNIGTPVKILP